MLYEIIFLPEAQQDLDDIFEYIADNASIKIALNYTDEIHQFCENLSHFPERGTVRNHILPGLRVIGFRRQVNIAFIVESDCVLILRILYSGRSLEKALGHL